MISTYEFQSDFYRRLIARSEARGMASALLIVLDARGIEVPAEVRERIAGCADPAQVKTWIRRAVTAEGAHDLFDG